MHRLLLSLIIGSALLMPLACGGGGGGGDGSDSPAVPLRILLTDAPFPFDDVLSATVDVHAIEIRDGGAGTGFQTLIEYVPPKSLNLVELRNGVVDVLYEGDPGPGTYDAFRIIVTAKEVTIVDGGAQKSFTDFKVPSGEQTGIKVFVDPDIAVTGSLTKELVLDFDLSRSFVVQGNPATPAGIKGFHFKPVIRAVNVSTAGSLTFRVKSDNGTPGDATDDFYMNGAEYTVTDNATSPPEVVAGGASGTDPNDPSVDGYVLHPAIPAGIFEFSVSRADHDAYTQQLVVTAANLIDLGEITLPATSGMIKGTVTTELTTVSAKTLSFAVPGAAVEAVAMGTTTTAATDTTSGAGAYALSPLAAGDYDITVKLAGYSDGSAQGAPWVFGSPVAAPVDLVLVPLTANLTGTVTDSSGTGVAGATVRATVQYAGGTEIILETTTDAQGDYQLTALPTGSYDIEAEDTAPQQTGAAAIDHVGGGSGSTVDITVS